jgi:hypothetical protein
MNNYIPKCYENNQRYKGLIIPKFFITEFYGKSCKNAECVGLKCNNCILVDDKILQEYRKLKERKEKIKCLNLVIE